MSLVRSAAAACTCALALGSTACLVERDYAASPTENLPDFFAPGDNAGVAENQLNVRNAFVNGRIGAVTVNEPANDISSFEDTEWKSTYVQVTANRADGSMGMLILNVDGATLRGMPAGVTKLGYSEDTGCTVDVTGCSDGPSYYDAPATDGEVEITDTPAGRTVTVRAELPSDLDSTETTHAEGSFSLAR